MPDHPKTLLRRFGLEAKKSLGQNFLVPGSAARIVRAAGIVKGDAVLEIGPGLGALTEALLDAGARVAAVDLDRNMLRILEELLPGRELQLIHGDARELELGPIAASLFHNERSEGAPQGRLKLVGNLPYYASSPIMHRAVQQRAHLHSATFTLQREVAERIAAPPGSRTYGSLSVLVGLYADARVVLKLPPGAFHPAPAVESAVLQLTFLEHPRAEVASFEHFERVVHAAFAHRRKTIFNSMRDAELAADPVLQASLAKAGIDPVRRAETVSVEEFARLAAALY